MQSKLFEIRDWFDGLSCAPTALAAVSGRPLSEIAVFLQQGAEANGRKISGRLLANYNLSDTLTATKLLGCFWLEADKYDQLAFDERPMIDEWMATNTSSGIKLVFCDDGGTDGHIFAASQGSVVDTYTNGRCVPFKAVPTTYRKFRVKLTFLILAAASADRV